MAKRMEVVPPTTIPKRPRPGSPEQAQAITAELRRLYPEARCSLNFSNPLELLVATQLAAQCTDERVNQITTHLFRKYRSAADYAMASQTELEADIHSAGFYRNKARNIRAACQKILSESGGQVPQTMAGLLSLAGVARKTANVVLGNAFGIVEGYTVDTHNIRLARRFGWTSSQDAGKIEQELMRLIPQQDWFDLSHLLIFHGRAICAARKPLCAQCTLSDLCPSTLVGHPEKALFASASSAETPPPVDV
ncbi:MAG TPA: endonuclease III [Ktedonobacteraceae bacterium]|jgi:endonuclease-3